MLVKEVKTAKSRPDSYIYLHTTSWFLSGNHSHAVANRYQSTSSTWIYVFFREMLRISNRENPQVPTNPQPLIPCPPIQHVGWVLGDQVDQVNWLQNNLDDSTPKGRDVGNFWVGKPWGNDSLHGRNRVNQLRLVDLVVYPIIYDVFLLHFCLTMGCDPKTCPCHPGGSNLGSGTTQCIDHTQLNTKTCLTCQRLTDFGSLFSWSLAWIDVLPFPIGSMGLVYFLRRSTDS